MKKAKELQPNLHHLQPYKPPDAGTVSHSAIWRRALARWKPGTRSFVSFPKANTKRSR